jgi:hypothetical protein
VANERPAFFSSSSTPLKRPLGKLCAHRLARFAERGELLADRRDILLAFKKNRSD